MSESAMPEKGEVPSTVHEVALRLQEQLSQTGIVSAEDVAYVLGDPRQGVSVNPYAKEQADAHERIRCATEFMSGFSAW